MADNMKGVQAGRAFVSLIADDSALVEGLKVAKERIGNFIAGTSQTLKAFGSTLAGYGAGVVKFGTGAAVAIATSLTMLGGGLKALFSRGKNSGGTKNKSQSDQAEIAKSIKESFSHIEFDWVKRTGASIAFSANSSKNAFFVGGKENSSNLPVPYGAGQSPGGGQTAGASMSESLEVSASGYTEEMIRFRQTTAASSKEMGDLGKKTDTNTKKMTPLRLAAMGVGGAIKGVSFIASSLSSVIKGVTRAFGQFFQNAKKWLSELGQKIKDLGDKFASFGKRIVAVSAVALGAAAKATQEFTKSGDELGKMSSRTGASVNFLSEMDFVAKMSGADISQVEGALRSIRDKVMSNSDDIKLLGIDPRALRFQPVEKQFDILANAVNNVSDAQRRATLGTAIFGAELMPMLDKGTKGIADLRNEARQLGSTMDGDQVESATKLADAWRRVMAAFTGVKNAIGNALAPAITDLLKRVTPILTDVSQWIRDNQQLIVTFSKIALGAALFGGALTALGFTGTVIAGIFSGLATIVGVIGTAISGVGAVLGFLLSPIGLVSAAVVGLAGYFLYASGTMGNAIDWLKDQFTDLYSFVGDTFQGIADAIMAGDLSAAFEVAMSAVKLVWLKATNWLLEKWYAVKYGIQDAWANTTYWISEKFVEATAAIHKAWVTLVAGLKAAWSGYNNWWQKTMNGIVGRIMGADQSYIDSMNKADDARHNAEIETISDDLAKQSDDIEAKKTGTLGILKEDHERGQTERTTAHAAALTEMEAAEQAARDKWRTAVDNAAGKRAAFEEARAASKAEKSEIAKAAMPDMGGIPSASGSGRTGGTFSAFEMSGLGSNIPQKQLSMLQEIRDEIRNQPGVVR